VCGSVSTKLFKEGGRYFSFRVGLESVSLL